MEDDPKVYPTIADLLRDTPGACRFDDVREGPYNAFFGALEQVEKFVRCVVTTPMSSAEGFLDLRVGDIVFVDRTDVSKIGMAPEYWLLAQNTITGEHGEIRCVALRGRRH